MTDVWIVAQFKAATADGNVWEFQGAFDSPDKAIAACRTELYCYFPARLNEELPDETTEPLGVYPRAQPDTFETHR